MKHSFSLTILLIALVLLFFTLAESQVQKPMFPTAHDVAKEYYLQNTVNHLVRNNYVKSAIDNNPSRYIILNGLPEDKDPNMVKGEINPDDSNPYYPYYDPSKHPFKPEHKNFKRPAHNFYDIYPGDTKPYYGPESNYRILDPTPNNGIKVDIKMGDLTSTFASQESIAELQQQLDNLDYMAKFPKKMIAKEPGVEVYHSDPNAYYDPTTNDLTQKREQLVKTIETLKKEYAYNQMVNQQLSNLPDIKKETAHVTVQNKINTDKEEQNNIITDGFYYPTPPEQKPQGKNSTRVTDSRVEADVIEEKQNNVIKAESERAKKDNKKRPKEVITLEPVDEIKPESKIPKPSEHATKNNKNGQKGVLTLKPVHEIKPELKIPKPKQGNPVESLKKKAAETKALKTITPNEPKIKTTAPIAKRLPDTQGLKTGNVKIIPFRKIR